MATETLEIIITGSATGLEKVTGTAKTALSGLANVGKTVLVAGLAAGTAAVGGLAAGLDIAIAEAMEAQAGIAQLDAVLKSTGGAAGVTRDMALDLADSLSTVTRFSDDAILSGENLLLTFTGIGKDIFPEVTEVMLDMSTAMGQDLKSSAIQLGKALNDPAQGLTALTRVGVVFTEEQKAMVEQMVEAGDIAGAQAIILQELQKEFGGSAEAAGQTFAGQLDILKNSLLNVAEGVGMSLLPILQDATTFVTTNVLPWVQNVGEEFVRLLEIFRDVGWDNFFVTFEDGSSFVGSFLETLGLGEETANALGAKFNEVAQWISGTLVPALFTLGEWLATNIPIAVQTLSDFWTNVLLPGIQGVWGWIQENLFPMFMELQAWGQENLPTALQTLSNFWTDTLQPAIQDVWAWMTGTLFPALQDLWDWLAPKLTAALVGLADFWLNVLLPATISFWQWVTGTLFPTLSDLWDWLQPKLTSALESLSNFWTGTLQPAITQVWNWMTSTLFPTLSELWTWLSETLTTALQTLADFWTNTLKPALDAVWAFIKDDLFPLFQAVSEFLGVAFSLVLTALAGIWQNILQPALEDVWSFIQEHLFPIFKEVGSWLSETFGPIIESFTGKLDILKSGFSGVRDAIQWVITKIQALTNKLENFTLPPILTPGSPTPFELGLRGIGDALDDLTQNKIPAFGAAFGQTIFGGAPLAPAVAQGAIGSDLGSLLAGFAPKETGISGGGSAGSPFGAGGPMTAPVGFEGAGFRRGLTLVINNYGAADSVFHEISMLEQLAAAGL